MYTSNKLFPGVIDTIPSDNNTRGHTFSQNLDWLSCGERWQSLHLLTWHIRSCMLCPAGANGMRSDQWQNKQRSHLVSRFGFVFLWWTMTKYWSVYMTYQKLYALPCWCQLHEKWSMTKQTEVTLFSRFGLVVLCGDWWKRPHLLIWLVRSCMLCSASSNDMSSDQWQTISVFPHLLPRFRLIVFR